MEIVSVLFRINVILRILALCIVRLVVVIHVVSSGFAWRNVLQAGACKDDTGDEIQGLWYIV